MTVELKKRVQLLASAVSLLLLAAAVVAGWFYVQLRNSRPLLDGTQPVPGLEASVTITRDDLGVPHVRARSRADVARALGFLHAQERFFQMDLLRRRPAGELAELVGKAALPLDRATKWHRFRPLAQQVLASLPPPHRALLESYAGGVNAGLAALRPKPFEYFLLRATPASWKPEDSILIVYAMTLDLQDDTNRHERALMTLRDELGNAGLAFFAPLFTPDDAALDASTGSLAPPPGPTVLDLRSQPPAAAAVARARADALAGGPDGLDPELRPGSNSFAVTGAHTANGAALLANDPHLRLSLPNIWYRALLEWDVAGGAPQRVVGVTIPGLPLVVLGSNGRVAWGLTVAYADTSDLVPVEVNPVSHDLYKIPGQDELIEIETRRDTIGIKGGKSETIESRWTHWGPIVGLDSRERPLAHRWVAYDPAAINLEYLGLETASTVDEAVAVAHMAGIPAHNFLVADSAGAVAWTIVGRFPRRVKFDGRLPVSWAYGDRYWDGYVRPADVPTVIARPGGPAEGLASASALVRDGRLWTANNRLVGGEALERIGDAGYMGPARAAQIRDALAGLERPSPRDFLALQLDDRALFHQRWQQLLLDVLTPAVTADHRARRRLREQVEKWEGRAAVDSVSFRLVHAFRRHTADRVLAPIFAGCVQRDPGFDWRRLNYEPALWALLQQRPAHLLPPPFKTWDAVLVAAADAVLAELDEDGVSIARATWGERNRANLRHPLAQALPGVLSGWLSLPPDPLPGDSHMPRIQTPDFGASMRLVVAPGHEAEALFEMPGGQSGHPLSPFYRAGHEAWVKGEPAPLLPGPARYTLMLEPAR